MNISFVNGTVTGAFASANVDALQVGTFLGVLITIGISWSSLNQQRAAAARESLEQLDDIEITKPNGKIKPILHKYKSWPYSKSTIKLQSYQKTEISGVSKIKSHFLAFPRCILENHNVKIVEDGYLIQFDTSDPVEIRRRTQKILRDLSEASGNRDYGHHWVDFNVVEKVYKYDNTGELSDVHEDVIKMFEKDNILARNDIRNNLIDEGYDGKLARLVLWDLIQMGMVEQGPGNRDFVLTSE